MKNKKRGLSARYEQSYQTKDTGANNPVIDWRKIKGEVKFFKPKAGKNKINIIPFEIKSKNHPLVKSGIFEVGDLDYVMDIYVHRNIGPAKADVLCLRKNYGKACPICEMAEEYKKKGLQEEYESLKPSRRVFYNVQDLKDGELKVFESSHYLFEKELIEEARESSGNGQIVNFADPEDGKTVIFRASEQTFGKNAYFEYKSFQFVDREEELDEEVLEGAISFDQYLKVLSYDEIEKVLNGADDDDDEDPDEDEKPAKKSKDDDDEDEKPAKKGKKPAKDDDDEDDDDDDDEPVKKPAKKFTKKDDDDEDEKPAKKPGKPAKKSSGECPHGHTFGDDCDEYDHCEKCDVWDACCKAG